ncbi:DUF1501 domain-containing protein [Candidatus Venteria ishoeyi]|uniref:DUF1501 domain-containing protein n=1 Tax=Candidatus Venteria ishoeyi TaxID=1899563 RepID=A0A1H6F2G8_9GAMM|nr:DUF1501 domain-containing protein [Candidatus Venteria ishoeyi]MDM8546221.1 DUF1501 domain-containing protein [Candidatus Venteria ishoeyi]SEH04358.1 Uncharacterised protein [Candidatus Venteria ishoeyi]
MKRRDFLKSAIASSLLMGSGLSLLSSRSALAATTNLPADFPVATPPKILLNISLDGGPDFRHLMPPAFSADENSFAWQYWYHRATSHSIAANNAAFQQRWDDDFLKPTLNPAPAGAEFGFLNSAGWLFEQWEQGNAAIVNNTLTANNRNHAHALLALEQGDRNAGVHDMDKPGWGGRLARVLRDQAQQNDPDAEVNIISLTREIRRFCYGPHASDPRKHNNEQVISVPNARDLGLFSPDVNAASYNPEADSSVMSRALKAYYAAKQGEMDKQSPYYKLIQHEITLRKFGDAMKARLIGDDADNPNIPIPDEIRALYDSRFASESGLNLLNNTGFGRQIASLYDCFACRDLLNFRIASLAYRGWDTHKNQKRYIEQRFADLFHEQGALATLFKHLPENITDQIIIVISGEFGRQLKANGDNGTDHGRGNAMLVLGKSVRGGLYGDPFPNEELERLDKRSPDITGKTGLEHVFAGVSDLMGSGAGDLVFPDRADAPLEDAVSALLFT